MPDETTALQRRSIDDREDLDHPPPPNCSAILDPVMLSILAVTCMVVLHRGSKAENDACRNVFMFVHTLAICCIVLLAKDVCIWSWKCVEGFGASDYPVVHYCSSTINCAVMFLLLACGTHWVFGYRGSHYQSCSDTKFRAQCVYVLSLIYHAAVFVDLNGIEWWKIKE